ncbi:hypothetical protein [Streptomyces sp. CBG33]|uniref:hypothetical protein n=1 Tax=Streptomyces sp. CBG33 TaxID=2762624 RepID=UPI001647A634|nr:hypothetical protein [Streptomyces sp. CBG33]
MWADCLCCWPQKPFIRRAVGWGLVGRPPRPPGWYVDIGGWPHGYFASWDEALALALTYLRSEDDARRVLYSY